MSKLEKKIEDKPSTLEKKVLGKKAKITIVGLGYVGLPLAVAFAEVGFKVSGFDVQKNKVDQINKGISYIEDVSSIRVKKAIKNKKLSATVNKNILGRTDVIIICVPTPLDDHQQPDISYIEQAAQNIKKYLKKDQLIILESTTYPGTTREVVLPILKKSGLKVGQDFFLAFSPERIDPGNKKYNVQNIPKVVGGISKEGTQLASALYSQMTTKVIRVSCPEAVEMTKLLENIFRVVNISVINELALLCDRLKIDIWEVIEAAKTKPYGFMAFYPGPGIGGHCIPTDPFYLSWKAKEHGFYARFIELAGQINQQMPHYVVTKTIYALNQHKLPLNGSKILVMGVTYKKDIADIRESAAYPIISDLLGKKANVIYHDPYIAEIEIDGTKLKSKPLTDKLIKSVDCVLIVTDHSKYDYENIARKTKLVVDARGVVKNRGFKNVYRI